MNTKNPDILNLVEVLARLGLRHVVLSPGSRNAPLIKAFNQHPDIKCHSIVDERSAGFVGLGMAQQLREPVAVVCTSGSALLNYGPAVCEAYYQKLPLLVISADRPTEWINQGDGQAINQKEVFRNFTKGYFELKESRSHQNSQWHNERSTAEAWNLAHLLPQGPVHLNVPLSEPLYELEDTKAKLNSTPTRTHRSPLVPAKEALSLLSESINEAEKVMILVGQHHPDAEFADLIHELSKLPQLIILTETTANLFGNGYIDQIDNALATISEAEKAAFAPTILVTFGGMVVTKRLKQFLRAFPSEKHIQIDPGAGHVDTYQHLSDVVQANIKESLQLLLPMVSANNSDYRSRWLTKKELSGKRHEEFVAQASYTDLKVFSKLLPNLPSDSILQIGNSTPIRYVQLFANKSGISHFCNRGVSGIDGCTSTAVGAALATGKPVTLISGELSFLYDNNGLWSREIPSNFTAIVINNSGGNIFRIIEGPDKFEEMGGFIETHHSLSVKPLAEMHGFRYLSAANETELLSGIQALSNSSQKTIFEIFTPQIESPATLKSYWKFLAGNA